jgi:hypothetical protein
MWQQMAVAAAQVAGFPGLVKGAEGVVLGELRAGGGVDARHPESCLTIGARREGKERFFFERQMTA